jgi:abortive infection bacteriophage resistance protein
VNYYRLSGYWYPFRQGDDHEFLPGTSFETIWRRYTFDRQLRLLTLDAIERFEVAIRTQFAYHHSKDHGPFGYATDPTSRPKLKGEDFVTFYSSLLDELDRSKEPFIKHFKEKYRDEHDVPPIWQAVEVMTFGSVVTLYRHTTHRVKQAIASEFGVPDAIMDSWLLSLNTVRNICAHHSRFWNKEMGNKPKIPHYPDWQKPVEIRNERSFGIRRVHGTRSSGNFWLITPTSRSQRWDSLRIGTKARSGNESCPTHRRNGLWRLSSS